MYIFHDLPWRRRSNFFCGFNCCMFCSLEKGRFLKHANYLCFIVLFITGIIWGFLAWMISLVFHFIAFRLVTLRYLYWLFILFSCGFEQQIKIYFDWFLLFTGGQLRLCYFFEGFWVEIPLVNIALWRC